MSVIVRLASVSLGLPQRLFQGGNSGQIFGVKGNIVNPAGAAVIGVGAVDGGHGDGYQERIGGGNDHFRDFGFCNQIQTQGQVFSFGLAVGIRQGHGRTVGGSVTLHGVLHGGGVGSQAGGQGGDQHISLIKILGCIQSVRFFVPILSVRQTQGFQEVRTLGLVHGVQDFHMTVGGFGFAVLENISYLCISKLDTLNGISVAGFAVAQSGRSISAQNIVYPGFVINAGRHIAGIPYAVLFGVGQIVLVDGQRAGSGFVDGCILQLGGGDSHREGQEQCQS